MLAEYNQFFSSQDPDVRSVLFEAIIARERSDSHLEWNLSPEAEISSLSRDSEAKTLFSDSGEELTKSHRQETQSTQDEALANALYAKFKEPVPPTPPACGDDVSGNQRFLFPTAQIGENEDCSNVGKTHSRDESHESYSSAQKCIPERSSSTSSREDKKYTHENEKRTQECYQGKNHWEENSNTEVLKYTLECDAVTEELITKVDQQIGSLIENEKEHEGPQESSEAVVDSGEKYFEIG